MKVNYPKHWELKKLGEISDFLDGKRVPIKESERSLIRGNYPYYGASGIIDFVNDFIFDDELILLGEDGENILSRALPLAFRVSGKCWVNNHAHVIKPKTNVDVDYLCYFLESISYEKYNTGTAQPKLNQDVCLNIPVIIPPLPEQRRIAKILSTWDEAIKQLTKLIELKEKRKKALMQKLLSDIKNAQLLSIEELCHIGRGRVISQKEINSNEGEYPVYSSQTSNEGEMGRINTYDFDGEYVTWTTDGANAGTVFYRNGKFNCTNVCGTLKAKNGTINMLWLKHELSIEAPKHVSKLLANPKLMNGVMASIKLRVPPRNVQDRIAYTLSDLELEGQLNKKQLQLLQIQKQGMMQQLLTGKVIVNS